MATVGTAKKEPNDRGRERRQSTLALIAWENELSRLRRSPTLAELFATIETEEWSYGFLLAVGPVAEASSLLVYGADFARLLDMPQKHLPFNRLTRQLPAWYSEVFQRGCTDACNHNVPQQVEGEVQRDDGRGELFRAIFIPIEAEGDALMRYACGRFNSRVLGG